MSRLRLKERQITTTTTLITVPTITFSSGGSGSTVSVPVAAIVGGVCAGVILAIVIVLSWKAWGRSLERQQRAERERKAVVAHGRALRQSTSDSCSRSSPILSCSQKRSASGARVKFIGDYSFPSLSHVSLDTVISTARSPANGPTQLSKSTLSSTSISPPIAVQSHHHHHRKAQFSGDPAIIKRPTNLRPSPLAPSSFSRPLFEQSSETRTSPGGSGPLSEKDLTTKVSPSHSTSAPVGLRVQRDWTPPDPNVSTLSQPDDSNQRWSWRNLLSGPGVSLSHFGLGINRLSMDTSSQCSWPERISTMSVGIAIGDSERTGEVLGSTTLQGSEVSASTEEITFVEH